jgi:zona occludens toxin (predicted ATPase)
MSIKVITGVPGSGKSYFALKEVMTKHFEWNDDHNEWIKKDDYTIISNIAGLRLPHIKFESYLKDHKIDYRRFFTVNYFKNVLLPEYPKIILLLDEAQKYFPKTFKDVKGAENNPEELSNMYFFEYHRHISTDIYIIGQLWTRFCYEIVNLVEYQIDAQRRTLSVAGEFRYFFRNGMDVYHKKTVKPDKKIFALYRSTDTEEVTTKEIRPIRKIAIMVGLGLIFCLFMGYNTYRRMRPAQDKSVKIEQVEKHKIQKNINSDSSQNQNLSAAVPPPRVETAAGGGHAAASLKEIMPDPTAIIKLGGVWMGDKLVAVEFFGTVVPVRDFTYTYQQDKEHLAVYANIPVGILGQVQRVQTGDYYLDESEHWAAVGAMAYYDKAEEKVDRGEMNVLEIEPYSNNNRTTASVSAVKKSE